MGSGMRHSLVLRGRARLPRVRPRLRCGGQGSCGGARGHAGATPHLYRTRPDTTERAPPGRAVLPAQRPESRMGHGACPHAGRRARTTAIVPARITAAAIARPMTAIARHHDQRGDEQNPDRAACQRSAVSISLGVWPLELQCERSVDLKVAQQEGAFVKSLAPQPAGDFGVALTGVA